MKKIKLTQGKYALVDDEDFEFISNWKWQLIKGRNTNYAKTQNWDKNKKSMSPPIYMHRLILKLKKGEFCDHINRNGLDNRRKNLRNSTNKQNLANTGKSKNNTSGFKGVSITANGKKWNARIMINRKSKHLGNFINKIDAAKAYDNEAKKIYKNYAKLNLL